MKITNHMTRQRKTPAAMTVVTVVAVVAAVTAVPVVAVVSAVTAVAAAAFIPPKASILPGTAWPAAPSSAVRASAIPDRIT